MTRRTRRSIFAAGVAFALSAGVATSAAPGDRANAARLFLPLARRLAASGVPVLVPGEVSARDLSHVRAQVVRADRSGYSIELEFAPDCDGANACHVGQIEGRRGTAPSASGTPVAIAGGIAARFTEGTCAAYCNPSTIRFERNGTAYAFSQKGSLPELKAMTASIVNLKELAAEIR